MPYRELLLEDEWQDKRLEILTRDEFTCQSCKNELLKGSYSIGNMHSANCANLDLILARGMLTKSHTGGLVKLNTGNTVVEQVMIVPNEICGLRNIQVLYKTVERARDGKIFYAIVAHNNRFYASLQAHYKLYIDSRAPWEYRNEQLITLCEICHNQVHELQKIPRYTAELKRNGELTPCNRFGGEGWFPEYIHVERGICFECRGACYQEFISN